MDSATTVRASFGPRRTEQRATFRRSRNRIPHDDAGGRRSRGARTNDVGTPEGDAPAEPHASQHRRHNVAATHFRLGGSLARLALPIASALPPLRSGCVPVLIAAPLLG